MAGETGQSNETPKPEAIDLSNTSELAQSTAVGQAKTPSADEARLERFDRHLQDLEDEDMEDDDDEDEHDHISHHPLLGMLAGRLGQPRRRGSTHKYDPLHPVTSVLSVANVDGCVELEAAFPEHERAPREKFEYRLSKCPELSLGLFTQPTKSELSNGTASKKTLIAMIVATRTPAPSVTDASMDYPKDWKEKSSSSLEGAKGEPVGHQEKGGTIALHSLVVSPEHQGKGLGNVLMKSYIQRIRDSKIADRIALIAHQHLEAFYTSFGFENMGPSSCTYGGGGWNNMILEFSDLHDEDDDD